MRHGHWAAAALVPLAVVLVTLSGPSGLFTSPARGQPQVTWLTRLYEAGYTPGDLILTNNPTVTYVYLGRTDFWLRTGGYGKYVRKEGEQLRDIHTNAVLLSHETQLSKELLVPYQGRTAWLIAWRSPYYWQGALEAELREALKARATQLLEARDLDGVPVAVIAEPPSRAGPLIRVAHHSLLLIWVAYSARQLP